MIKTPLHRRHSLAFHTHWLETEEAEALAELVQLSSHLVSSNEEAETSETRRHCYRLPSCM